MANRGFTLVELLVVLAVGSILLAIAVPGQAYLVNLSRVAAATNDFVTALHLARSESIKRGMRVTLCKSSDPMATAPACDAAAAWGQGWLVFVDSGTRGIVDGRDVELRVQAGLAGSTIAAPFNYSRFISYLPSGTSQGSGNLPNGTLILCAAGNRRDIVINGTGRPRLEICTC